MRTIGILGGIGPQATMDLEARIHRVAQQCVPQHLNTGYPPLVSVYMRHPPVRVDPALLIRSKRTIANDTSQLGSMGACVRCASLVRCEAGENNNP